MKIAFIWDWDIVPSQTITWKDGLAAAIKELSKKHDVKVFTMGGDYTFPHSYFPIYVTNDIYSSVNKFHPDVVLIWGDTTRPAAKILAPLNIPMAMCFAGGHQDGEAVPYIKHYFVESQSYKDSFEAKGRSVSTAFGTNTELFQPLPNQQKVFDALMPGTFALWKRHNLFAEATKEMKACAVGYMYDTHEMECWQVCEQSGSLVLPHCSPEALQRLYAASKCVVIPSRSDGGSQRTVLEAMAMNIPVVVCEDSDKTSECVREGGGAIVLPTASHIRTAILNAKEINTRDYILSKWSEYKYAEELEKWLLKLVS